MAIAATLDMGRACAAAKMRCSAMTTGGISRMASKMRDGTKIRSSKYPRTGMKSRMRSIGDGGITSDHKTNCLGIPRQTRVAACKVQCMHIPLDDARPVLQRLNRRPQYHVLLSLSAGCHRTGSGVAASSFQFLLNCPCQCKQSSLNC